MGKFELMNLKITLMKEESQPLSLTCLIELRMIYSFYRHYTNDQNAKMIMIPCAVIQKISLLNFTH